MEAARKRIIRSGEEYTHLFPKSEGTTATIRKNADVTHTVAFIPKVVNETLHQTKGLSQRLKGGSLQETCSNIWHFVYQHIAYKKDQDGYEQIRSPARAWHDRKKGVDCDCYTVFISSILTNLQIPHILRITKYHRDYFQHIYPVVPFDGKHITLDCVTDQYDYEVPYSQKKDYPMDLQYLNGFDGDLIGELGKVKAKKGAKVAAKKSLPVAKKKTSILSKLIAKKGEKPSATSAVAKPQKKGVLKKVLNTVNKANPATVLLRNGVLAAMKLNVKNIAKRLRWSYLTPEQAAQKGIDPQKFQRLIAARQKLEKIFYGAGGNEKNLKKAILEGKGNTDKAIAGLGGYTMAGIEYASTFTPLPQLLGRDIYYSENVNGFEGLGQLGEPVTLASVGAAMGVLAGIVAALKQIGDIFPKKTKGSEDFDEKINEAAENNVPVPGTTPVPLLDASAPSLPPITKQPVEESFVKQSSNTAYDNAIAPYPDNAYTPATTEPASIEDNVQNFPVTTTNTAAVNTETPTPPTERYWDKNKAWLKPVVIGVGGIGLLAIGFAVLAPKKGSSNSYQSKSLSGVPKHKKKKSSHHRKKEIHKTKHTKKTAVALL